MPGDKSTDGAEDEVEATTDGAVNAPAMRQHSKHLVGLHLENIEEKNKDIQSSDTENASPAIGPKDITCVS